MKVSRKRILCAGAATLVAGLVAKSAVQGASGTWTNLASSSWGTATNWAGSIIASGTDAIADFSTLNITANNTVTLDGARTVGGLRFADATTASNDWILNTGTGGPLTLDVSTGMATINVTTGRTATIGAVIAGNDGVNVTSATSGAVGGNLILGAANTFTGGLRISGGTVQLNNAAAAGTDTITLATSANTAIANKLVVNAGVTITNPIVIESGATGLTGRGVIEQVGTGLSTVNGAITINGGTTAGGHFLGGAAAGSELVLGGPITSSVIVTQRTGRVIYRGGGTGYATLGVTGTALVGVTNGIATSATVALGASGAATLDLNGFDQTLVGVTMGDAANNGTTVALGARTLTLTGDLTTAGTGTHSITGAGTLSFSGPNPNITVANGAAANDLTVAPIVAGSNGFTKGGLGNLVLNGNVTNTGSIVMNSGDLVTNGSLTGASGVTVNSGTLTTNGAVSVAGPLTVNFGTLLTNGATTVATGPITNAGGSIYFNGASTTAPAVNILAGILGGNSTINAPVTMASGSTLIPGTLTTPGTLTASALTFDLGTTTANFNLGAATDLVVVTSPDGLSASTTATLNIFPVGGPLPIGTYDLIKYSGAIKGAGFSGFALGPIGHNTASLINTGTAVALRITALNGVVYTGASSGEWDTATANWKLMSAGSPAQYIDGDDVLFDNSGAANQLISLNSSIAPARLTFTNTAPAGVNYEITGVGGIDGTALVNKTGDGGLILRTVNSYSGATTVTAGTLELDHDAFGNAVLTGTSGVSVGANATLKLTRDDGGFTFNRNLSGNGTVIVDSHSAGASAVNQVGLTGNNAAFTGLIKLSPTAASPNGLNSFRWQPATQAQAGSGTIQVDSGGQFWAANTTYSNPIQISGIGYVETAGGTLVPNAGLGANAGIGAIRMDSGAVLSGPITLNGNAKIMAFGGTGTISGNITSLGPIDQLVVSGGTSTTADTLILTGTNTYGTTFVNSGSGTTAVTHTLQIGNNGTTGTLGTLGVTLNGETAVAVLRFDRTDGYTLGVGNDISSVGTVTATQLQLDVRGTGFVQNGRTIDLGGVAGGIVAAGNTRANGISNFDGPVTAGNLFVGSAQPATVNLNSGANISVGTLHVARTGGTNSVLNIKDGSTLAVTGQFNLGEQAANNSGTANQTGGSVSVAGQMRVGHWPTETSSYNLSGGSLDLTAAPSAFPFTATAIEQNGGIYLGIDGTGNFNLSGTGALGTNFIVLDNRTETLSGANTPTGVDTFTMSGGTLLLKSGYGIISRFNSAQVNFTGGTLQAALGVNPALDSNRISIGGQVTFDTNGGSIFSLYGPLAGNGAVLLSGGGTLRTRDGTGTTATVEGGTGLGGSLGRVRFEVGLGTTLNASRTGTDIWSGALSGPGTLLKDNTGSLFLTGDGSGFTGTATVAAGRLQVPVTFGANIITVADGAAFGGEPSVVNASLGSAAGSTLYIDGATPGAFAAANLTLKGTTTIDFSAAPSAPGPITVVNYGTLTGTPTFALANASGYRTATFDTATLGTVKLNITTKALTWTGASSAAWSPATPANFTDGAAPDGFFAGDTVTFDDSSTVANITVTPGVSPWKTSVTSNTTNYVFTSTGAGIAGPGNLEKSGSSNLTLSGPNTYSGQTVLNAGTLTISAASSLGNASTTNSVVFNGGKLTASASMDLGLGRGLIVMPAGGTISAAGAAALTVTIPGSLSGSGNLNLTSGATTAPTFVLSGNGSGFTGNINVDSVGATTGGTTLRLASNTAVTAGTIFLNPPLTSPSGAATGIDLSNVSIGGVTLSMTSLLSGTNSFRSQIVASAGTNAWNGPIILNGDSINQVTSNTVLSLNGPIDAGATGFTGIFFLRGSGTGTVNGQVNMPAGTLAKTDAAVWTINSTGNNWSLTSVLSAGGIKLGATNALPITASLNIGQASDANSGVLDLSGFDQEVSSLTYTPGNGNSTRGITNTVAGTLSTLTVNTSAATASTFGATTGVTGGVISGNLKVVKAGPGTLTLGGVNTYTGGTLVSQGTLKLGGNTSSLGAANSVVTVSDGAVVDVNGFVSTGSKVAVVVQGTGLNGTGALVNSGTAATVNTSPFNLINFTGGDLTYNSGTVRFDYFGQGTVVVNGGTNTLTKLGTSESWWSPAAGAQVGNLVVNAGIFGLQSTENLGSLAHSLTINAPAQMQTFGAITNSKPVVLNGGQMAANNSTSTFLGTLTLAGTGTTNRIGTVTNGVGVVLNGKISGEGWEKIGGGTVTIGNATNDYSGNTLVTAGTVTFSPTGKLSPNTVLDMNGGTVNLAATTQSVNGLQGAGGTVTSVNPGTLAVNQLADANFGGSLAGSVSLVKAGPGALTLSGGNTATGTVDVTGGRLIVANSLSGSSSITVAGGATLGGTGLITPGSGVAISVATNGNIAPGAGLGTLQIDGSATAAPLLTLSNNARFTFDLDATGASDKLLLLSTAPGDVAFNNNVVNFSDLSGGLLQVGTFTLIDSDSPSAFSGLVTNANGIITSGLSIGTGLPGFPYSTLQVVGDDIVVNVIPEPISTGLLLAALPLLLGRRRRRS